MTEVVTDQEVLFVSLILLASFGAKEIAMEDVNQLFDAAFEFAHYPGNYMIHASSLSNVLRDCSLIPITVSISGPQGDSSVKEFLDRFPLPVIFK